MQKNTASQKFVVFAFDRTTNIPKTGDAANITANLQKDFGTSTATNDVNPTELEDGYYSFDATQAETNADSLVIYPASGTADIQVIGVPAQMYTVSTGSPDEVVQTADNNVLAAGSTGFAAIDTVVDAIKAVTDVQTAISPAAMVDLVWDEILTGGTHNINNSSGKRLRQVAATIFSEGTAQSGGNNSIQLEAGAVTANDQFRRAKVIIIGGTGVGQEAIITDSVASTDTLTLATAWLTNPDATSEYEILPAQTHQTVRNGGYDNGFVYFSTGGDTGTQRGVNGTSTNPVGSEADAYTIMTQENITNLFIEPGSAFTLPSDSSNKAFRGSRYTIALNSQNIDTSEFHNCASVTGIATTSGNAAAFFGCGIGTVTLPPVNGFECGFFGTFTIGSAGNFTFGASATVFDNDLTIDYGSGLNASQFYLQSWGGGEVEIQNAGAGTGSYVFEMNGAGHLAINANCSATTSVDIHGAIELTNNASGITVNDKSNATGVALGTAADTDIATDLANIQLGVPTAAQLAYIVANAATGLPVTFTTSGGGVTTAVINNVDGSAGSATNDQYNGRLLVFTNGTLKGVVTDITDYVGSTTTATITAIPFAPTASHTARLI